MQLLKTFDPASLRNVNTKWFFVFLFLFQVILIFQGIDLSDEGFLSIFYQQIFKNPESVQYNFMFWGTGIIGGLYFKLFSFLGVWGLRLGGVLVTTGTAVLAYRLLKNYLNEGYLKLSLFLIVITLNNDIKEINYNNLSALFNLVMVYLLYRGLKRRSALLIFLSGSFVALNVFIRPPNLLCTGIVGAVLYYGLLFNNSRKTILQQTVWFLAGFAVCFALILLTIRALGHWEIFTNAIRLLFNMGKVNPAAAPQQSDYGIFKLFKQLRANNLKSVFISLCIFGGLLMGITVFSTIKKKFTFFHKLSRLIIYLFALSILILTVVGVIDHWFILYFYTGIIVIVFVLLLLIQSDPDIRFLMACGCFILITYPFASSAGILTAGRYSFWIGLPIAINYLFNIHSIQNDLSFSGEKSNGNLQVVITHHQLNVGRGLLLVILVFNGLYYSYNYPFFDWRNRAGMHYPLENRYLKGIYTTRGRAEVLNELLAASNHWVKKGDYVLAYDCLPMYNFLTETTPYIRSAYPWLYESEIFKSELDRAKQKTGTLPVVVIQTIQTIGDGSGWPEKTLTTDYSQWDLNQGRNKYMNEFLEENHYREVWTNKYFKILIPS